MYVCTVAPECERCGRVELEAGMSERRRPLESDTSTGITQALPCIQSVSLISHVDDTAM